MYTDNNANYAISKANIDEYLKELAKEFRKRGHGEKSEIVLIGGGAVLTNYNFREGTQDIDALYVASGAMEDSIKAVRDKENLPDDWLNNDFTMSALYSPRLREFSQYYRTYSNVLEIRTVKAEYLVAMKLMSGRKYKSDLSDIAGIIDAERSAGKPLTYKMIDKAMCDLYGDWNKVDEYCKNLLTTALEKKDLGKYYKTLRKNEKATQRALQDFEMKYPKAVTRSNIKEMVDRIIEMKKKEQEEER